MFINNIKKFCTFTLADCFVFLAKVKQNYEKTKYFICLFEKSCYICNKFKIMDIKKETVKNVLEGMFNVIEKDKIELYQSLISKKCFDKIDDIEDFYFSMMILKNNKKQQKTVNYHLLRTLQHAH